MANAFETEEEMIERIRNAIPLGRWGEPFDIARGVAFLCSPAAAWITGEHTFLIDDEDPLAEGFEF